MRCKLSTVVLTALLFSATPAVHAIDATLYADTAETAIKLAKRGKAKELDKLEAEVKALLRLGIEGCLEYAEENPTDAKMMHLVVLNSARIPKLPKEQIDAEWNRAGYLKSHGIDVDKYNIRATQLSLYFSVVRPAAALAAIASFRRNQDGAALEKATDVLIDAAKRVASIK